MNDHATFVMEQVGKTSRPHFNKGDHVVVQCPIHSGGMERTPSRKINISNPRYKPLESYCFACHDDVKRISWNELAAIMNMSPVQEEGSSDGEEEGGLWLQFPPPEDFYGIEAAEETATFPWKGNWKRDGVTISGKFLRKMGARLVNSRDEPRLYLPVTVDGVEVGNTQAVIDKTDESSNIKYLHSGKWTQWTLYPVDEAFPLAEKLKYLLLVEGARDALNLMQHGVPAVCIWGTGAWTKAKRELLEELAMSGVKLVIAMDGDDAGRKARDKIETDLKGRKINPAIINFEDDMDPGKLTPEDVAEIANMFGGKRKLDNPRALNDNAVVASLMRSFYRARK